MISHKQRSFGFTLIELLVAMAVFLVVVGAAVSLFRRHVPLFSAQQSQTGVNIALRNAAAQVQLDLVNAGAGFYQGINVPSSPVGVTIQTPAVGTPCFNAVGNTYGAGCFDTLSVVTIDSASPPGIVSDAVGVCADTQNAALYATPVGATTLPQLAAAYRAGDEILLVKGDGSQLTTVLLTANAAVAGGKVQITHNPTNATGTWLAGTDPLGIGTGPHAGTKLGNLFCSNTGDWMLKLSSIRYAVDTTNANNPVLTRTPAGGQAQAVADQVIGFKVGIKGTTTGDDYVYDPAAYGSDWTTVRSVRISLIGRTNPVTGSAAGYRNNFDNGNYKVEGVSVVVNPRNLSMNF